MRAMWLLIGVLTGCTAAPKPVVKREAPQVRIARVGGQLVPATIAVTGTIALQRETSLGFTSPGRIASLRVDDGDLVRRGQVLAALDTTTVGADLSAATAERERAAADYGRLQKLFVDGWVTRPRVESAKATLAVADARVRATGFQSSAAVIIAPGAGRILARLAEPGQVIAAGTPVLVLGEAASGYVVRVPLTDRDAARVRVGAPAQVTLASGIAVSGQVSEVAGRSDPRTGTFAVEIALPPSDALRSGQIASARIVAQGSGAVSLAVPPPAVFAPRAGEGFVYVVDRAKNHVALRRVQLGETSDQAVVVTGGIVPGEWVAVSRLDRLTNGMTVAPIMAAR